MKLRGRDGGVSDRGSCGESSGKRGAMGKTGTKGTFRVVRGKEEERCSVCCERRDNGRLLC